MDGVYGDNAALRRLESALTTTLPTGANATARSSETGGRAFSSPTQIAPRAAAARGFSPRVTT
jgi:hypothetical protein